jgi:hypothetical protein
VADYGRAREEGAHHDFDRLRDLEQELLAGKLDPQAARVAIDSIKWRLSKQLPRIYGDRQTIEHQGEVKTRPAKDMCPEWLQQAIEDAHPSAVQQEDDEPTTH